MSKIWYYDERGKLRDENGNKVINLDPLSYILMGINISCILSLIIFIGWCIYGC